MLSFILVLLVGMAAWPAPSPYPSAPRSDQVDVYHGVRVPDPFRTLENADSPTTKEWIDAENGVTQSFLSSIPQRGAIRKRVTELWNYERYSAPWKEGERYFYFHNNGLQNQGVLFSATSLDATPRVVLDPNLLSADGTVAVNTWGISRDGRYVAYGLSSAGSDWVEIHVRRVEDGVDLPDVLKWVKFSGASWLLDGSGFLYSRYDEPRNPSRKMQDSNYFQKVYFHRLGTSQASDVLVYERPDQKEWGFNATATRDGHYVVIHSSKGTDRRNRVFVLDLTVHPLPATGRVAPNDVVALLADGDAQYGFIDNDGPRFWFHSTWKAPRGEILAIDLRQNIGGQATQRPPGGTGISRSSGMGDSGHNHWKVVVPESPDTLEDVSLVGDRFIATYLHDAHTAVRLYDLNGKAIGTIRLPGSGSGGGFTGHRKDTESFYGVAGFASPTVIYRYDLKSGRSTVHCQPSLQFDPAGYETRQIFYRSKDGTRVPMFISSRKGLSLDGTNPTLLYGYGGFNIPITPSFSPAALVWMEMGGVYAVANIRGGGEYGEAWHEAGMKLHKQNVFDDFIGAAEWLIANKYTSREKLAIRGRSNGGLLVGAVMTQRPDLFGAALPGVGVLDMLRFHKFTIGWAWTADYGSPDNPAEFQALYHYSPLHNIKPGTHYPATFIVTADHDDRVVPAHSFKFTAALQAAQGGSAPVLIRIETKAGHGGGKPTTKAIEEVTDEWTFLVKVLKMSN